MVGTNTRVLPLSESDLPELFAAIAVPDVFAGGYGGGAANLPSTLAEFAGFAAQYYDWSAGNVYGIRITGGPDDGVLVGTSTLGDFDEMREHAHIGWTAFTPRVWGTAANPEAKLLMLTEAFDHGFGRVKIQTDALNARSRAAILGLGAVFEGITRRDVMRGDGTWRDTAVYAIVVDGWPRVQSALEARLAGFGGVPVRLRR